MTQLTDNIYAVEVPENMNAFKIDSIPEIDFYQLDCYEIGEYNEPIEEKSIDLPPGSYEFLFATDGATEEDARKVVGNPQYDSYGCYEVWSPYGVTDDPYDTAGEALNGLLTSKGLNVNKNYVLLKKTLT